MNHTRAELEPPFRQSLLVVLSAPSETFRLLLDMVSDRERDLILLNAGFEDLVVDQRARLRFEKYGSSLLLDLWVPKTQSPCKSALIE